MKSKDFAVFILSHGRADTISTYRALRDGGYTGRTYVVIDNEDDQEDLYRQKFGDDIIQFDKRDYLEKTDLGDLDTDRRIGVFARNFIQDEAKRLGYKFHLQLDDDVHGFGYRFVQDGRLRCVKCNHLDEVLDGMVQIRSLKFETEELQEENHQGNAVVNYTDARVPFTRVIEHKHFTGVKTPTTIITKEYPQKWDIGKERYYPIENEKNKALYQKYKELADRDGLITVGRLAEYKYYDMEDTIKSTLKVVRELCEKQ